MLRSLKALEGYITRARDGEIGKVVDFFFDDDQWVLRYLEVDTGDWLEGRHILLSSVAVHASEAETGSLAVNLDREQVRFSPAAENVRTPSRQFERELHAHYDWPIYWDITGAQTGMGFGSLAAVPELNVEADRSEENEPGEAETEANPNLRSLDEVLGYKIQARDGDIGNLNDFIINDEDWSLLYLIVDTGGWLSGKKVLVSPQWVEAVRWPEGVVQVDLKRETIQDSPEYDPTVPLSRSYESKLYDHYGREKYW